MLHGSSKYVFEDGATGQMEWTARLVIDWTESEPLIETYHIFPVRSYLTFSSRKHFSN